jgi:phosphoglycerate dehydrogenase-like enzyme
MTIAVHLLGEQDEEFLKKLVSLLRPGVILTFGADLPASPSYNILVCGVPNKISLEASPNLKHLIIPWAGLPVKTRDLMLGYPHISVHNIHHNAAPVAELAISMMLALAKGLISIDASMRKHDWSPRYKSGLIQLLTGKKVLILGFGAVGRQIATRCQGLGMKVSAIRREDAGQIDENITVYPASRLDNLLLDTEVLFLALPLTEQTKKMIGAERLSMLPERAIVINISRGRIIDEKALYESLQSGRIKAGLDVWYNYPGGEIPRSSTPPSTYPFHELANVIMTPHLAGNSDGTEELRAKELARLLNLALQGNSLPNQVDLTRGY